MGLFVVQDRRVIYRLCYRSVHDRCIRVFLGTGFLCVAALVTGWQNLGSSARTWCVVGSIFYIFGCIAVTIIFNVPLNNKLVEVIPAGEYAEKAWSEYLLQWGRWNHVRSIATLASTMCFIIAVYSVR